MSGEDAGAAALIYGMKKQRKRLRAALATGMPRLGWKICVNERSSQERLGLAGPFVGFLNGARCLESGAVCALAAGAYAIEPEIAIRVGASVKGDADLPAARRAIESLSPALEIVDYLSADPDLESIVESSSFHFGLVLGTPCSPDTAPAIGPGCPDLVVVGRRSATPDPALVPEDLAEVVLFAARFLSAHGEALCAGDLILSGACTNALGVRPGDEARAGFGALGAVSVSFVAV